MGDKIKEILSYIGVGLIFLLAISVVVALIMGTIFLSVYFPILGIILAVILILFFAYKIGKDFINY